MIFSILGNVKYKDEALLQQNYTSDFITKTVKKNIGELNQYYITAGHEAIIDRQLFDYVQEELKRRAEKQKESGCSYLHFYSEKIVCGTCSKTYRPRMWHPDTTNDPVWACANRNVKSIRYRNPHLYEKGLDELLRMAMQTVLKQRLEIAAIVEEAVSGVIADEERRESAGGYIHRFTEIPASELSLDLADFAIILKQITIRLDGTLTVDFLTERRSG